MKVDRPFAESGSIPVIINKDLTPSFGTGIHSVSPAHCIDDLDLSYAASLSRAGCVDPETGHLTKPEEKISKVKN